MRTESAFAILAIIGSVMKILHLAFADHVLILALTIIALLYFPGGFYFFCDTTLKQQNIALSIISGFFLSIVPIGILFKIMHWPFAKEYLNYGIVCTPALILITYYLKTKGPEDLKNYYRNMLIRMSILTIVVVVFNSRSDKELPGTEMVYRNEIIIFPNV